MHPSDIDSNINGNGGIHPTSPVRPVNRNAVQELGQELAELARNLSGSLQRLSVRSGDCVVEVEWHAPAPVVVAAGAAPSSVELAAVAAVAAAGADAEALTHAVRSPLVGTYFAAPAPDADPFVKPGDQVEPGQTLAIVEAMKMMNAVVAERAGVVGEILVSNGDPVEYDQPLLVVLPVELDA